MQKPALYITYYAYNDDTGDMTTDINFPLLIEGWKSIHDLREELTEDFGDWIGYSDNEDDASYGWSFYKSEQFPRVRNVATDVFVYHRVNRGTGQLYTYEEAVAFKPGPLPSPSYYEIEGVPSLRPLFRKVDVLHEEREFPYA